MKRANFYMRDVYNFELILRLERSLKFLHLWYKIDVEPPKKSGEKCRSKAAAQLSGIMSDRNFINYFV